MTNSNGPRGTIGGTGGPFIPSSSGPFLKTTGGTVTGPIVHNYANFNFDAAPTNATALATGVISGGIMTVNGSNAAAIDISALTGVFVDYVTNPMTPTVTPVNLAAQTAIPVNTSRVVTWWMVSPSGTVIQQATQPTNIQRRQNLQLGVTAYSSMTNAIFNVQTVPVIDNQFTNQMYDLFYALGAFNVIGNQLSANGANLSFNKSAGTLFSTGFNYATNLNNPHVASSGATSAAPFRYSTQLAGSESLTQTTVLDVGNYDLNGVITAIPGMAGAASIHRVFLFATNLASEQFAVQYGQHTYNSLASAQSALPTESFITNPDFFGIGVLIGYIIVTKSATALNNVAQAVFVNANRFATN